MAEKLLDWAALNEPETLPEWVGISLPVRVWNALKREMPGVTPRRVAAMSDSALMRVSHLGRVSINTIREALAHIDRQEALAQEMGDAALAGSAETAVDRIAALAAVLLSPTELQQLCRRLDGT